MRALAAFDRTRFSACPAPSWQLTTIITLVPGDPTPSSGPCRHACGGAQTCVQTKHIETFKKEKEKFLGLWRRVKVQTRAGGHHGRKDSDELVES